MVGNCVIVDLKVQYLMAKSERQQIELYWKYIFDKYIELYYYTERFNNLWICYA